MDKNTTQKLTRAEYRKKWREENKEHLKRYYANNAERISKKQKEWRKNNPGRAKELWDEWYKMNKVRSPRRRLTEAKHTAKRRKIEWNLTLEEYSNLIAMPCYYCNNQLGEPVRRSIGLDRLNPNEGYTISNVVSCCYICNCIKNEFLTPEETKAAVQAILEVRNKKLSLKS